MAQQAGHNARENQAGGAPVISFALTIQRPAFRDIGIEEVAAEKWPEIAKGLAKLTSLKGMLTPGGILEHFRKKAVLVGIDEQVMTSPVRSVANALTRLEVQPGELYGIHPKHRKALLLPTLEKAEEFYNLSISPNSPTCCFIIYDSTFSWAFGQADGGGFFYMKAKKKS